MRGGRPVHGPGLVRDNYGAVGPGLSRAAHAQVSSIFVSQFFPSSVTVSSQVAFTDAQERP